MAFVFAIFFLVCAGLAIGVRTGNLGLGTSTPDGAWIAGTVLAVAGGIGVVGTVANRRRPTTVAEVVEPEAIEAEEVDGIDDVRDDDRPDDQS